MSSDFLIRLAKILERTKKLKNDITILPLANDDVTEKFYNAIAREIYEVEEILKKKSSKAVYQGPSKPPERK